MNPEIDMMQTAGTQSGSQNNSYVINNSVNSGYAQSLDDQDDGPCSCPACFPWD